MSNDDTIDIRDLLLIKETDLAYCFQDVDGHKAWIPKSQIKSMTRGNQTHDGKTKIPILEIPQWLADEKELF